MSTVSPKNILVTGATDGIGKATALALAQLGHRVILHGRSPEKVQQTQAEISRALPVAQLETVSANLASLAQVRALATEITSRFERLDVLLNNAGVFMKEYQISPDGFEMTLAVNHLAPFLLTHELLPLLRASQARVVTVSSVAHTRGQIHFDDLNLTHSFEGYRAYAQSKLANLLFSNELAEREMGKITSNSLHPGGVTTKLLKTGFGATGISTTQGAETSVFLATSPTVESVTGKYFSESREAPIAPQALNKTHQKQLWQMTEQLLDR